MRKVALVQFHLAFVVFLGCAVVVPVAAQQGPVMSRATSSARLLLKGPLPQRIEELTPAKSDLTPDKAARALLRAAVDALTMRGVLSPDERAAILDGKASLPYDVPSVVIKRLDFGLTAAGTTDSEKGGTKGGLTTGYSISTPDHAYYLGWNISGEATVELSKDDGSSILNVGTQSRSISFTGYWRPGPAPATLQGLITSEMQEQLRKRPWVLPVLVTHFGISQDLPPARTRALAAVLAYRMLLISESRDLTASGQQGAGGGSQQDAPVVYPARRAQTEFGLFSRITVATATFTSNTSDRKNGAIVAPTVGMQWVWGDVEDQDSLHFGVATGYTFRWITGDARKLADQAHVGPFLHGLEVTLFARSKSFRPYVRWTHLKGDEPVAGLTGGQWCIGADLFAAGF